jgi:hypothetical protein
MAKQNKTICLDSDIIEELEKVASASKLINDLLRDYFVAGGNFKKTEILNKISIKELEVKKIYEELKSLNNKLDSIEKREKKIKTIFKNIPDEVLEDFKVFGEKINYTNRFIEIWKKKYDLTLDEVKKAYDAYFEKEQ